MTEPERKPVAETTVVSKPFRRSFTGSFFTSVKKHKRLTAVLLLCLLVVAGSIVWWVTHNKPAEPPALQVGKYSYSRAEYNKLIAQAKAMKVPEYAARQALKEGLASRQAADDLHINYPTDKTFLNNEAVSYHKLYAPNQTINDYQRDTSYTPLIKTLVALTVHGRYKVGYLDFPFARYIVAGNNSQWHNVGLIQGDISYAKSQAEDYKQALLNHDRTLEELVSKAQADKRLTYGQAGNLSDVFYVDERGTMLSSRSASNAVEPSLLASIKLAKVGKISDIKTKTWSNDTGLKLPSIQHGFNVDVSYYFIVVQEKTTARPNVQNDFNTRKQGYL